MEPETGSETLSTSTPSPRISIITLQKAIDLGEYEPEKLSRFPDWHLLDRHAQFQLVRQALRNRSNQLWTQYAEIFNQPDFSQKPHLQKALDNTVSQIKELKKDEEQLQVEYSS